MARKSSLLLAGCILLVFSLFAGAFFDSPADHQDDLPARLAPTAETLPVPDEPDSPMPEFGLGPQRLEADQCSTGLYFLSQPAKCISGDGRLITAVDRPGEFALNPNPPEP